MANYLCVDGGTTNTRISIVSDHQVIDTLKFNIGARKGIDSKAALRDAVQNGIAEILIKNDLKEQDVARILASGMITSEFGLLELAHVTLPVGIGELHDSMCETVLDDISSIPFVFVRGVKTDCKTLEGADMMRGEETELMGIVDAAADKECVYILSGSHSKIIYTDKSGRITDFFTTMTGEMIYSLSQHTILKNTVDLENTELNDESLIAGYECCRAEGINKALFKVRISDTLFKKERAELYSFFMGVVLCGEITDILNKSPKRVVIGGKKQIGRALYTVLKEKSDMDISFVPDETVDSCVALGAVRIYEYKLQQKTEE